MTLPTPISAESASPWPADTTSDGVAQEIQQLRPAEGATVLEDIAVEDSPGAADVAEQLDPAIAAGVLSEMNAVLAASVIIDMEPAEASAILEHMEPDDRVDLLQHLPSPVRARLVATLGEMDAAEVRNLSQYPPDSAGGIMTSHVTALRRGLTVDQAIGKLRQLSGRLEQIFYVYVVESDQRLIGVLSMRDLILAAPTTRLARIMKPPVISVAASVDQEDVARLMRRHGFLALPVVDPVGRLIGLITADDVQDVEEEEATEDMQKLGGSEALDAPYLNVGFLSMVRKRGGWLAALFLGEMLTATAMGHFEHEIQRAAVVALFVPLIISTGGNSGSQATSIVIRSLALRELQLKQWLHVLGKELRTSLALGAFFGVVGFARICLWYWFGWHAYGGHPYLMGLAVSVSLVGVVMFGSITGSMLPFLLRRFGFDPATASAPFVATLVDVTGLVIYFTVALLVLRGTLL